MSTVKFQYPPFKPFEPGYHSQKPIILGLDDRLESPETTTLRYEEAVRAGQGGDPVGDSPPRFPEMAAYGKATLPSMAGYDDARYEESSYEPYSQPSFSATSVEKYAQLNQQAFAANNAAVADYITPSISFLSCQPTSGPAGTKVALRVSATYELLSIASPMPFVSIMVGSEKCAVSDFVRNTSDTAVFVYSCSVEMPHYPITRCETTNVPLQLLIQGASGEEISRTALGTFEYVNEAADAVTGQVKQQESNRTSPTLQSDQASPPLKHEQPSTLSIPSVTNTFDYPTQQSPYAQTYQPTDMITAYRSQSFAEPYHARRAAPATWAGFGTPGSSGRAIGYESGYAPRHMITTQSVVSSNTLEPGASQLIRTSAFTSGAGGQMTSGKAEIHFNGKLDEMTRGWTRDELQDRRRIVGFHRTIRGGIIHANFKPVASEQREGYICISCIFFDNQYWVTSVDAIALLEKLVTAKGKFTVEEKNRIRRNLEGFGPKTVAKSKETDEFFRLIMGFPPPRPRNIEKDVKVFEWKSLEPAVKKIIGKYTSCSNTAMPPGSSITQQPGLPPSSHGGPYSALPTPPAQTLSSQHGEHHNPYSLNSHNDHIPSPRPVGSSGSQWSQYTAAPTYGTPATRALSPHVRYSSPQQPPSLRVSTNTQLPSLHTYDARAVSSGGYGGSTGLQTPISHHPSTSTPPRWEGTPVTYGESYSAAPSHHLQTSHSMYNPSSYGDGATRA